VAVNPLTNNIYVTNYGSHNVTAITEQVMQPSSPLSSINGIPQHTSYTSDPTFTIQAESHYTPIAPRVQQVYYQVDTWQGEWLSATENPGLDLLEASATTWWKAKIPPQGKGIHILYAYAVDGQDAGSVNPSPSYSPNTGRISAYLFLVRAPVAELNAVAVNPVTNKIYVTNYDSDNVTVIDGATNLTTTVAAGSRPTAVAVNPVSNKIYVANYDSANVTVIDGATNATTTVTVGTNPYAVAVNPVRDESLRCGGQPCHEQDLHRQFRQR
jgi:YVTN family beta-propeller protein